MNPLSPLLKNMINKKVNSIILNDKELYLLLDIDQKGNKVEICFSNDEKLTIEPDYYSHFYGESDLEISLVNYKKTDSTGSINIALSNIYCWFFTPKGINIFPEKYIIHIDFILESHNISVGFIEKSTETDLVINTSTIYVTNYFSLKERENIKRFELK